MKVFVVMGATGLIGSQVVTDLRAGHEASRWAPAPQRGNGS
jgi:uncharacterized protein YbjT (DUF2867 family)